MNRLLLILKYFVLGMIQGVSEMLPISSSGHMKIVEHLFGIGSNDLSLEILFHLSSLLALLLFFSPSLKKLVINNYLFVFKRKSEYRPDFEYFLKLVLATIPAGVLGILFKDKIESIFDDIRYVCISLLITSFILYITYKTEERNEPLTYKKSFIIGMFQGLALIPGISRSGSTYMSAKKMGVSLQETSQFIFLMLIPIAIGSFVLSLDDIMLLININTLIPCIVGFISAFIFTYISLSLFNRVMKNKVLYFSIYCFTIGISMLLFL